jgi:hypothetical protein
MLSQLAQEAPDAEEQLSMALSTARDQANAASARGVPVSPSVWFELERATQRLQGLVDRIDGKSSSNAPSLDALAPNRGSLRTKAVAFYTRIKDETIALERRPPERPGERTATASPVFFSSRTGQAATSFPYRTQSVFVRSTVDGLRPGQRLTMKVYAGTVFEARELRREQRYTGDGGPVARFEIAYQGTRNLPPGPYRVEMYVENHLVTSGAFSIDADTPSR